MTYLQQPSRRRSGYVPRQDQPAAGRLHGTANGLRPTSATRRTNPWAIAALVCGILAFCGLGPIGIAAIILGHKARGQIRRTGENGYGLAKAGLVLGYLVLALSVFALLVILAFSHAVPGTPPTPQP